MDASVPIREIRGQILVSLNKVFSNSSLAAMGKYLRFVALGLTLIAIGAWVVVPVQAQVPALAPPAALEGDSAVQRPSARQLEKRFLRGRELLDERNYVEATRILQSILESEEDDFFHPDPEHNDGERSLKFETQALLGNMPREGREVYEKQYGPIARRLLTAAIADNDADRLGAVTRRFFHTQAGYEAVYRLGGDQLNHGHPLSAALCFERLRRTPHADDQFEPLLSLKTALSWQRAGRDDKAVEVLTSLKQRFPRSKITVGGREVALFQDSQQPLAWLASVQGPSFKGNSDSTPRQWTMFRGDARRNAEGSGGSPYLNRGWRASTLEGSTDSRAHDALVQDVLGQHRKLTWGQDDTPSPLLPAFQPLVVGDLLVARGFGDLRAYELSTGRLAWASGDKDQLLLEKLRHAGGQPVQLGGMNLQQHFIWLRAWGDLTYGAICSDGDLVFTIEDAGTPNPNARLPMLREFNQLSAFDARTGKAVWEVGGPRSDDSDELGGVYFLGAPLVLDHRLYALVESGIEVRLVVLEPRNGRLIWSQTLNDDPDVMWDVNRRSSGLTPAYDGGILVCPTGSDQATAVDLTGRSLLWRYRFRSRAAGFVPRIQPQQVPVQVPVSVQGAQNRWLDGVPVIGGARVLFTPRDSTELHCVNLLDGSLAWKRPRGDGLFIAGVVGGEALVVGRSFVQALGMSDGQPVWPQPATIPLPGGRGFISAQQYHLPLSTKEVATIDLRDGRILFRTHAPDGRELGNLLGLEGRVISQGADFLDVYPQLETLGPEVAGTLAANPDDTEALALRGKIRLQKGDIRGAYADLLRVLMLKSNDADVRALLIGSLLDGLRVDFTTYRNLGVDYDQLLIEPDQRTAYLWVQAGGLEQTGELQAAFEALLKFADEPGNDRVQDRLDAMLTVRRDRLVRSRAERLHSTAKPADRERMEAAWRRRADDLLDRGDTAALGRFLEYFGELGDAGELARHVALGPGGTEWLSEEFLLRRYIESTDPQLAAAAAARLVNVLLAAERPNDAAPLIKSIETRWPDVASLGGRSGSELVAEWKARPDVARSLAPPVPWPTGRVTAEREPNVGDNPGNRPYTIALEGDRRPFFTDVTLEVSGRFQDFIARDGLGRQVWKLSFDSPIQLPNFPLNRGYACGHLLIVAVFNQIMAIDTLGNAESPGPRVLWKMNLTENPGPGVIFPRGPANRRKMPFNQNGGDQWGTVGPVTLQHVVVLRGRKLHVLEPLTGKPYWIRDGIVPGSEVFGDDERLFVVSPESNSADVYHTLDGRSLGSHPLPTAPIRLETVGRNAVLWQRTVAGQGLSALDIEAENTVWKLDFSPASLVAMIEGDEAAVLEPNGRFTVVSLGDGAVTLQSAIEPWRAPQQMVVLRSREQYVLITQEPFEPGEVQWIVMNQNVHVHGNVHGFDRASGKRLWTTRVERQGLDPSQPSSLPILTFVIQGVETVGANQNRTGRVNMMCLDRRTGRIVWKDEQTNEPLTPIEYAADHDLHQLELKLFRSTVRLTFTDKPWP